MTLWKAVKTLHEVINGRGGRSKSDVFLIPESKILMFFPLIRSLLAGWRQNIIRDALFREF